MPCDCSYMDPTDLERQLSRVLCLLDELATGKPVDPRSNDWCGHRIGVYGSTVVDLRKRTDEAVAELCGKLKKCKKVSKYSLELQLWWREHQAADKIREEQEKKSKKRKR